MSQAPQIVFLKQGTDVSQGRQQLISNMNACMAVVDIVSTTLGPLGMDKLIYSDQKSVRMLWTRRSPNKILVFLRT